MVYELQVPLKAIQEQILKILPKEGRLESKSKLIRISHLNHFEGSEHCLYSPGIALVVQGDKKAFLNEHYCTYGAGEYMIANTYTPSSYEILGASETKPFLSVMILFETSLIIECLDLLPKIDNKLLDISYQGVSINEASSELLKVISRLIELLNNPRGEILEPLVLKELYLTLLSSPEGQALRNVFTKNTHTNKIAGVIQYLKEHFKEPLNIDDLASLAFMAPSTFFKHFKAVTSISPLQYQKKLRLYEAKRLMLSLNYSASEACFAVGYESRQQFTREYKKMFGKAPLQDVKATTAEALEKLKLKGD